MIDESYPWRKALMDSAERLEARKLQQRWRQETFHLVERDVMLGFFAIRRLIESFKVPDSVRASTHEATRFAATGVLADVWNRFEIWDLFDLENPETCKLTLREICNQFIHSWIHVTEFAEDRSFSGFMVSSDWARRKYLYSIDLYTVTGIFRTVSEETVISMEMRRLESGEMSFVHLRGPSDLSAEDQ